MTMKSAVDENVPNKALLTTEVEITGSHGNWTGLLSKTFTASPVAGVKALKF